MKSSGSIFSRLNKHFNFDKTSIHQSASSIQKHFDKDQKSEWQYLCLFMRYLKNNRHQILLNDFFKTAPIKKFNYTIASKNFYHIMNEIKELSTAEFGDFIMNIDKDPTFQMTTSFLSIDMIPTDARKLIYKNIERHHDFFNLRTASKKVFKDSPLKTQYAKLSFSNHIRLHQQFGIIISHSNLLRVLLLDKKMADTELKNIFKDKKNISGIKIDLCGMEPIKQHILFFHKRPGYPAKESALLFLTEDGRLHNIRNIESNCLYTKTNVEPIKFASKHKIIKFIMPKSRIYNPDHTVYKNGFGAITNKGELLLLPLKNHLTCYTILDSISFSILYNLPESEKAKDIAFNNVTQEYWALSETNNLYRFDGECFNCVETNILAITNCDTHMAKLKLNGSTLKLDISGDFRKFPKWIKGLKKSWDLNEKQLKQLHLKQFDLSTDSVNIYLNFDGKQFYMIPTVGAGSAKMIDNPYAIGRDFSGFGEVFYGEDTEKNIKSLISNSKYGMVYIDGGNRIHKSIRRHNFSGKPLTLKDFVKTFDQIPIKKLEESKSPSLS